MTWVSAPEAARRLGIDRRNVQRRSALPPDNAKHIKSDGPGRYWIDGPPAAAATPAAEDVRKVKPDFRIPQPVAFGPRPSTIPEIKPAEQSRDLEKWILIPDCHVPYQHVDNFALVIRTALAIGCGNVCVLGDFADCYAVSRFSKNPQRRIDLGWEIDEVNKALDLLDRTFTGQKKITLGNHEKRMERFIAEKAPELSAMMKIDEMLRLRERGWLVTEYMDHTTIGKLHVTHEVGNVGVNAHRQAQAVFNDNIAIGHTHMLSWSVVGSMVGKPHVCAMLGWLGDVNQIDYQHRAKVAKNSAQGFGVAYVEPDGCVHLHPVAIVNGKVCVEGRLIS